MAAGFDGGTHGAGGCAEVPGEAAGEVEGVGEAAFGGDAFEFEIGAGEKIEGVAQAEGEEDVEGRLAEVLGEKFAEMLGADVGVVG